MMFNLEISLDNSAFYEDVNGKEIRTTAELSRLLRLLSDNLKDGRGDFERVVLNNNALHDINGNNVGWSWLRGR